MRVLFIVQQLDERNWLRSFIVDWVRALAVHVEEVYVLTLELGEVTLPSNVQVRSMGKEHGYTDFQELMGFYRGVLAFIGRSDVVFSHMTPIYTILAAPLALLYRKPQMLWFTHRQSSLSIRLALALSKWVTTAASNSFPISSSKVYVMGHGIDTHTFVQDDSVLPTHPRMILAVGRLSPIKNHHTLLEAAALLRDDYGLADVIFVVAGEMANADDEIYKRELLARREELGLENFQFLGPVETDDLIEYYRQAWAVTNLSPPGLFDKAVLEAMLTGNPVLVCNSAFNDLLLEYQTLLCVENCDDASRIAAALANILSLTLEERYQIGKTLSQRTASKHGLDKLMEKVVKLMS